MSILSEFREFAMKGNVVNLAVGVIIGGAFAIFMAIKVMNRLKRAESAAAAPAEPTTRECPQCLSAIPLKATRCPQCTSLLQ